MITLKQFMLTVDYRITEGSDYQWQCFGPNAYCLDSWNGDHNGYTVSIIFDNKDQTVYQAMAYDYANNRAYRMTNPDYKQNFDAECENRAILDMAWEDDNGVPVKYVDLELEEDFLEKARAIINDEDYDTRVQIPVEFGDDELLTYMKMAHDRDMTFNQFVEMALREVIEQDLRNELNDIRLEYDFSQGEKGHYEESIKQIKKKKGTL
jgi:hypothetical protein